MNVGSIACLVDQVLMNVGFMACLVGYTSKLHLIGLHQFSMDVLVACFEDNLSAWWMVDQFSFAS